MRRFTSIAGLFLLAGAVASPTQRPARDGSSGDESLLEALLALERSAIDRWLAGDPQGYLDLYAPEVSYFDPTTERRVDGREAMEAHVAPMKNAKRPYKDPRYEMIGPKVQRQGDVALLSFNLVQYGRMGDRPETLMARWNSTEAYRRIDGRWRIIHSHWSLTRPELQPPGPDKEVRP